MSRLANAPRLLRRVWRVGPVGWRYLARASLELARARWRHATRPASVIVTALQAASNTAQPSGASDRTETPRIAWAINAAAGRVPWRADCLLRVMAADHWLRRFGRSPQFYLGVQKMPDGGLLAHAWLQCDGQVVTGGSADGFTMLLAPDPPTA